MADESAHIIYVHGLWMNGTESLFLRRRVAEACGARAHAFAYKSVTSNMAETTERLQGFVRKLAPQRLHLIGHSLGGLVIYRFLERYPDQPPGRVVFLGTPSTGSRAAVAVRRMKWAVPLVGRCIGEEFATERARRWTADRDLGIIAGTLSRGLGQFFAGFQEESDGTVAVSETRMPGAKDHLTLPVSHMGMVLSAKVARETSEFLQTGRFSLRP
ncbi:MAG: alpha/beta hydrolase [Gammaproteobacteria bacterium]